MLLPIVREQNYVWGSEGGGAHMLKFYFYKDLLLELLTEHSTLVLAVSTAPEHSAFSVCPIEDHSSA